ncbi:MAG: alpha/beta hydrolase [Actinobacteria bacterium]|nr:alpha/beta hydrolase [Actinomycetota bacterium]
MTTLTRAEATDAFRRDPDRFLDVGAGEVAYRRFGTGPDVLFVHGWPVSGATFRALLPHLVEHVTCHVIDFPGAGSSRFDATTPITIDRHIQTVRTVVDLLGLESFAVVGHDSGGMIARHALAGDPRVRAWGLVDTEQPQGLSWRFRSFLLMKHAPGLPAILGWLVGNRTVRRTKLALGDAFVDRSLLDGEFDELFLAPIHDIPARRAAAAALLRSFDPRYVAALGDLHRRIEVPVHLVWGECDPFFPLAWTREMVHTFPDARLTVIEDATLFVHEERPAEVAAALLPQLRGG